MNRLLSTELHQWDLLGGRISFDIALYLKVIQHKRYLLYIFLALLIFISADPSNARDYVPLWFAIGYWPIAGIFYVFLVSTLLLLQAMATRHVPSLRVPSPLIGLLAIIPTVLICKYVIVYMSGGTFKYDVVDQFVFYFLTVQGLETVFYRFILPDIREEIEAENEKKHLIIGGEQVDLSTLIHIEAREHHVHLTFENEKSRARARLGDIVAQTSPDDGVQPHRSWWVARDPAIRIERKNGRLVLLLRDNTEVPVARTRVDDVLNWLEGNGTPAE